MPSSDTQLIAQYASRGDADSFAELVSRHHGMVRAVAMRVLHDRALAEDVSQECFVRLAREAAQVRRSVASWLHRTAVNASIDVLRRSASRRKREETVALARPAHAGDVVWDDVRTDLDGALGRLPARLREPLVMHFLEGRDQQAVADCLGLSQSAVSRRIRRGVARLRRELCRKGVPVSAVCLAALLAAEAVEAAPEDGLLASRALAAGAGSGRRETVSGLSAGGARMAGWTLAGKVACGIALIALTGVVLNKAARSQTGAGQTAYPDGVLIDFSSDPVEQRGLRWIRWEDAPQAAVDEVGGRTCCVLGRPDMAKALFLDVDDGYFCADSGALRVEVEYLDRGTNKFGLQYDSTAEGLDAFRKLARFVPRADSGEWRTAVFFLNDARCETRYADADLVVRTYHTATAGDLHVRAVRVSREAVSLQPGSDCLAADGESSCEVVVTARDASGAFLPDGTDVRLRADRGRITPSVILRNGCARARYRSGTEPGACLLSAAAGQVQGETRLHLLPGRGPVTEVEYLVDSLEDLSDCTASGVGLKSWSVSEHLLENGRHCARIDYASAGYRAGQYQLVELRVPRLLVGKPTHAILWVYNDGGGGNLDDVGVCDADGEVYQIQVSWENPVNQWFDIDVALDAVVSSWYESGNGQLDYPLTLGFVKVHPSREPSKGRVLVRDIRVRGQAPESETVVVAARLDPDPEFFAGVGDTVRLLCSVANIATRGQRQVLFSWHIALPTGQEVLSGRKSVLLDAMQTHLEEVSFVPDMAGDCVVSVCARTDTAERVNTVAVPVVDTHPAEQGWEVSINPTGLIGSVCYGGSVCLENMGLVIAAPRWAEPRLLEQQRLGSDALARSVEGGAQRFSGVVTLTNGGRLRIDQDVVLSEDELALSCRLVAETDIETEAVLLAGYIPIEGVGCPWYRTADGKWEKHRFPRHQMGNQLLSMGRQPDRLGWLMRRGGGVELVQNSTRFSWWQIQDSRRFGLDKFEIQLYVSGKRQWKAGEPLEFAITLRPVWWATLREEWTAALQTAPSGP